LVAQALAVQTEIASAPEAVTSNAAHTTEFLGSRFDRRNELFLFVSGMLIRRTSAELVAKLKDLARDFAELHREDVSMPLNERHGTSLLLATRLWEPRAFRNLRRADRPPAPAGGLHPAFVPSPPAAAPRRGVK